MLNTPNSSKLNVKLLNSIYHNRFVVCICVAFLIILSFLQWASILLYLIFVMINQNWSMMERIKYFFKWIKWRIRCLRQLALKIFSLCLLYLPWDLSRHLNLSSWLLKWSCVSLFELCTFLPQRDDWNHKSTSSRLVNTNHCMLCHCSRVY